MMMPDSIGPAGNASQVINVPPPQTTPQAQQTIETEAQETEQNTEVAQTERVPAESNVGNNVDTTA